MKYDNDNIFAKILRGELPSERVYEDEETLALMDIMPRADGHVIVIPKTPARNMLDATPEQLASCMASLQKHAQTAARLGEFSQICCRTRSSIVEFHTFSEPDYRKIP